MVVNKSPSSSCASALIFCICLGFFAGGLEGIPTTDPTEVRALNSIFSEWQISSLKSRTSWNTSGELCSGAAIDSTTFDDSNFNPGIKCDCSFKNNSICHITQLKVDWWSIAGVIPNELKNLTYLSNLQLYHNYLTGPLPAFIGSFSFLEHLNVSGNLLSGSIPKELGNLQNLISLGLGMNSFSSPLPPELGKLTNLQKMHLDSHGSNGDNHEMPSTFSQLQKLEVMWVSDCNFIGKIPDFIGSFRNLTELRLHGNFFSGPIPSNFGNLTKLTDLRIGEVSNGSSPLDFIENMTSLSTLVLRNSEISGNIPTKIGDFTRLKHLDLSFNNLVGIIPQSLFNLSSIEYLFLGNNSLSGSLPSRKGEQLHTIDLSYNELSGDFPTWVRENDLQLNLVANNFIITKSNSSLLPAGLSCLQKNFPCNHDSPVYSYFAINCGGGKSVTSSDETVYEMDKGNLGAASYHVTGTIRWAVSNSGRFLDAKNPAYVRTLYAPFANTMDSELFQSARLSASSLRYYGLGLEDGNYTVKLQFGETDDWKRPARRVFDIYIQGNLVVKDFDIGKEAGGQTFTAVKLERTAVVTKNFLEIHFFWAGKGTCCLLTPGSYGPSISAISVTPNFTPNLVSQSPTTTSTKKKSIALIAKISAGVTAIGLVLLFGIVMYTRKRTRLDLSEDEGLLGLTIKSNAFSYTELRSATEDFNPANKLGEGGFGPVFKGTLSDGRVVAVKQLSVPSLQGRRQFVTEISAISAVQHRNLVKLYGYCCEGDKRLLVYEYMENKSLDKALFGKCCFQLDWATRFKICLGTARAIAYLHEESRVRIIHRDVKASNILLDKDLNPKISDFGLAKLYHDKQTHISTKVAGTVGYLAPEYAMRGHLTEKADLFSFGVVSLEILCGRPNNEPDEGIQKNILEWAWHLHKCKSELELVDPTLPSYNKEEARRVLGVALLCTQASPRLRPTMSQVVDMLVGDLEVRDITSRPGYLTDWQFNEINT